MYIRLRGFLMHVLLVRMLDTIGSDVLFADSIYNDICLMSCNFALISQLRYLYYPPLTADEYSHIYGCYTGETRVGCLCLARIVLHGLSLLMDDVTMQQQRHNVRSRAAFP